MHSAYTLLTVSTPKLYRHTTYSAHPLHTLRQLCKNCITWRSLQRLGKISRLCRWYSVEPYGHCKHNADCGDTTYSADTPHDLCRIVHLWQLCMPMLNPLTFGRQCMPSTDSTHTLHILHILHILHSAVTALSWVKE